MCLTSISGERIKKMRVLWIYNLVPFHHQRIFELCHTFRVSWRFQGERVKIPLLPNKVGKRSGTMVRTLHLQILTFENITFHIMLQFFAFVGLCKNACISLDSKFPNVCLGRYTKCLLGISNPSHSNHVKVMPFLIN